MPEKTIAEKMYVKNASTLAVLNDGGEHGQLLAQLPAQRLAKEGEDADWLLVFARSRAELEQFLPVAQARLAPGGALWVAYRKGGRQGGQRYPPRRYPRVWARSGPRQRGDGRHRRRLVGAAPEAGVKRG